MQIERNLGADVIMQFDHVIPGQSEESVARDASERSVRWLERCVAALDQLRAGGPPPKTTITLFPALPGTTFPLPAPSHPQALFPIIQGGIHESLRRDAARTIRDLGDWSGFGIGGLSVGEAKSDMYRILEVIDGEVPRDRPRYLMGVGFPEDLVEGVLRGVDLFDCVAPTRMGRNGTAFTPDGRLNIKRAEFRIDPRPLDDECDCAACRRFSRGYLRHLFVSDEMLGLRLLSLHNVHFLVRLMRDARDAIRGGTIGAWSRDWLARYHSRPVSTE
jgi:queuine tRNA-ribosyltransferase